MIQNYQPLILLPPKNTYLPTFANNNKNVYGKKRDYNSAKKDIARQLFIKGGFTQVEIADKVAVSKVTINKWIKGENWDKEKNLTH